jgi:pimeloyl-ACP methyl ester carboxylesterase
MPRFTFNHLAITFEPRNQKKRAVIFIHGNSQNDSCGHGLKQFFTERGHSYLSYDLPGHGDSVYDQQDYSLKDLTQLNIDIIKHYNLQQAPILIGHSFGGMIQAATIAQFQLNDASLILCSSFDSNPVASAFKANNPIMADQVKTSLNNYIDDGFKLFKQQKKYDYFANNHTEEMIFDIFNRRYSDPQASANNIKSLQGFSAREYLSEHEIPVLVLHGENDGVIPKEFFDCMQKSYSQIKLEWYSNRGHHAFFQEPEMTNHFLAKHSEFLGF